MGWDLLAFISDYPNKDYGFGLCDIFSENELIYTSCDPVYICTGYSKIECQTEKFRYGHSYLAANI